MLDHNSIDLFTFFSIRPASVTWQRTYATLKSPELFLWSPSLEACSISNLLLYMTNEADKLRHSVLHIRSTSEIQIWDVRKNLQVPPFQQCKGMPTDCFCDPNFCVIYTVNHLLFWPYNGFIFHFIQPYSQLLLTSMVLLHLFWKYVPSAVPTLDTEIMWPLSVPQQCIASGKKTTTPKQEMSFLLNQCPTQIQTITCNCRTVTYNTWGERGKGNGRGASQQLVIQHTELWKSAKKCNWPWDPVILTSLYSSKAH